MKGMSDKFVFHLELLYSIPEFEHFIDGKNFEERYSGKTGAKDLAENFKEFILQKRIVTDDELIIINTFVECVETEHSQNGNFRIANINNNFVLNEDYLDAFNKDFKNILTGDTAFKQVNKGKYKTNKEFLYLQKVDDKGLYELYEKYQKYNHPYIFDKLSEPMIKADNLTNGVNVLRGALKHAFKYPNYFWESLNSVDACATSLYRIQELLGLKGIKELNEKIDRFEYKLMKLIFLYLSRVIYMKDANLLSMDAYSNRGRIVRDYKYSFLDIFGPSVNSDIQYMSDKYLAYLTASKNQCAIGPFQQYLWDSMKMYRHGHHIPNHSGGYQEIEDAKFIDLVKRGELRSIALAEKLLIEFENQDLNLTNSEIDLVCDCAIRNRIISNF